MREIVLDTETTGLDAAEHRIVEIACVELLNHVPTGTVFHCYVNPEREVPDEAFAIHGLSTQFLAQHPPFGAQAAAFLAFIGNDRLVIHNAEFDLGFLNAELARLGLPALTCPSEDTLALAKRRFPGAQASLDALCRRFEIDLSERTKHNALLDCRLLAEVYLELIGGRQPVFEFGLGRGVAAIANAVARILRPARPHAASAEELAAHARFLEGFKDPIWLAE
jgi:DNA polymerase-3 subunit epsilon